MAETDDDTVPVVTVAVRTALEADALWKIVSAPARATRATTTSSTPLISQNLTAHG